MRIICPSCAAEYTVPASRLKPGKMVRCARCANSWSPDPEPEPEAVAAPPDPAENPAPDASFKPIEPPPHVMAPEDTPLNVTAMDRLAALPAPQPRKATLLGAWALSFVVLAAAATAVIGWREAVMRAWPPSSRILAAIDHSTPPPEQVAVKKPE